MNKSVSSLLALCAAWAVAVAAAGALHLIVHVPPAAVLAFIGGATLLLTLAVLRGPFGPALDAIGPRGLLAINLGRIVGLVFVWLHAQGRLPVEFSDRAGWGDVAAAGGALVLILWNGGPGYRPAFILWNLFGMLDLVVAVGTAGWLNVVRPGAMAEMASFPLCLVPFWAVPILMSTHLFLLRRLTRECRAADGDASRAAAA